MKRFYFLIAAALLPLLTYSQSNYKPGYILKNNGDTLKGYINIREWNYDPEVVEFKGSTEDKNASLYSPLEIKGFYVAPSFTYKSYIGNISNNKSKYPNIDSRLDTTSRRDTVFLEQLVAGANATLYSMNDMDKLRFFYREQGTDLVELRYYNYFLEGSTTTMKTTTPYVYQLWALNKKYPGSKTSDIMEIQRISFNEDGLSKFFRRLNNIDPGKDKKMPHYRFFAGLGASVSKSGFTGENRFTKGGYSNSTAPKLSVGADVFNNPVTQRVMLRGELFFTSTTARMEGKAIDYQNKSAPQFYEIKQYTVAIAPQLLFNLYSADNLKAYLGAGAAFNFSIYPTNRIVTDAAVTGYYPRTPYQLKSTWISFPLSAGVVINKHYEISAGYVPLAPYTNYTAFSISTSSFNAGIKYLF